MIFAGLLTGLILATWPSWQISKTAHDLSWVLAMLRDDPDDPQHTIRFLFELNFDRHLWRRLTCRTPWTLYSPELRAFLGK